MGTEWKLGRRSTVSKPIRVGDLVAIVRWPCCGSRLGHVDTVVSIEPEGLLGGICVDCHTMFTGYGTYVGLTKGRGAQLSWLRRIPPIEELESEKRGEEITA